MKIGHKFNTLTLKEYFFIIDNYKKYTDFNILGIYRSILENEKLSPDDKKAVRDHTHIQFIKTFEFLQMKDPGTYFKLVTQGQELTKADERQFWDNIKKYQQKTLSDKRIKHRNFGEYSKHNCGRDNCHLNGIMIRQDSDISYGKMHFDSDKHPYSAKIKSEQRRKDRKKSKQNIKRILDSEYNKSI